jgi:hypothetical protein
MMESILLRHLVRHVQSKDVRGVLIIRHLLVLYIVSSGFRCRMQPDCHNM